MKLCELLVYNIHRPTYIMTEHKELPHNVIGILTLQCNIPCYNIHNIKASVTLIWNQQKWSINSLNEEMSKISATFGKQYQRDQNFYRFSRMLFEYYRFTSNLHQMIPAHFKYITTGTHSLNVVFWNIVENIWNDVRMLVKCTSKCDTNAAWLLPKLCLMSGWKMPQIQASRIHSSNT